jgi:hypothetical protein
MSKSIELPYNEICDAVEDVLLEIQDFDLQVEVIASALMNLKFYPKMDISTALLQARIEWDV